MTRVAAGLLAILLSATPAYAQQAQGPRLNAAAVERAVKAIRLDAAAAATKGKAGSELFKKAGMSKTKRGIIAALAGTGGFFGGLFLGAAIEGDRCNCDDPGLVGALIGAPVGAAAGAIAGWFLSR